MTLGIIGGMGTEATSYFFEELANHTKVSKDQDHIDTVILNHASLPDRTEAILSKKTDKLLELLIKDVKTLEKLGVENIAIPCNTSHYLYDDLQKETAIPIIHMIRESVVAATTQFDNVKKIGIMATNGTIRTGVYHKEIEALGLTPIVPSEEQQADVMSLIYDDIKSGKSGDFAKYERAYHDLMAGGSDVIILACTELSVFKKKHTIHDNCLDALDILVKESIERSNAVYQ